MAIILSFLTNEDIPALWKIDQSIWNEKTVPGHVRQATKIFSQN